MPRRGSRVRISSSAPFFYSAAIYYSYRGLAQFGSATGLGPVGRGFKSCHPDHLTNWRARRYSLKRSDSGAISSVGRAVVSKTTCRGFESYCPCHMDKLVYRGVAQFGSATGLGPVGRGFKSCHPDHFRERKRFDYWAISSVGQSIRLITGRSGVQVPDGPPQLYISSLPR